MKKLLAILICLSMMLTALPVFGESAALTNEEAFKQGLQALMNSIDFNRDQFIYTATSGDETIVTESIKANDGLMELFLAFPQLPDGVTVQFNNEEIYAALNGSALHLRFEDVPAILQSLAATFAQFVPQGLAEAMQKIDPDQLKEMGQMLLQRLMMGMKMEQVENGMVISYEATGKDLIAAAAGFVDDVLANEEYADTVNALVTVILAMAQSNSAEQLPTAEEFIANWPTIKEHLLAFETDFALSAKLFMANDGSAYKFEASAGANGSILLTAWDITTGEGNVNVDGKLTQRQQFTPESDPQDSDINIHFDLNTVGSMKSYNFSVEVPDRNTTFKLNGTDMGGAGKASLSVISYDQEALSGSLVYALSNEGLSVQGELKNPYESYGASLAVAQGWFSLKLTGNGETVFAADMYLDENGNVTSASLETPELKAEYDGEKLVIVAGGVTVTCTGEYESANAYVITMKAEGETVPADQDTAYIRVEYEGTEGDWALTGYMIDPEGNEMFRVTYGVAPTEPIVPIAETYAGNVMEINAPFVTQMVTMLLSQYTTIGE